MGRGMKGRTMVWEVMGQVHGAGQWWLWS